MNSPSVASPAAVSSDPPGRYPAAKPDTAPTVPHTSASPNRARHASHHRRALARMSPAAGAAAVPADVVAAVPAGDAAAIVPAGRAAAIVPAGRATAIVPAGGAPPTRRSHSTPTFMLAPRFAPELECARAALPHD